MPIETPQHWLDERFPKAYPEPVRRALEFEWWLNLAAYAGHFYLEPHPTRVDLILPPIPSYRVRYSANHLATKTLRAIGRLLRTEPSWLVGPNSTDAEDQRAARIGEKVLIDFFREQAVILTEQSVLLWAALCGKGWFQVAYDPTKGPWKRTYIDPETGRALPEELVRFLDPGMRDLLERDRLYRDDPQGQVSLDSVSTFAVWPESRARKDNEARYVMKATIRHVDEVLERWGKVVPPETAESHYSEFQMRLLSAIPAADGTFFRYDDLLSPKSKTTVVKEVWSLPTRDYPRGRQFTVASNVVLEDLDENPWMQFQRVSPLVGVEWYPFPDRPWGKAYANDIRPINLLFNNLASKEFEALRLMANPKWFVPEGSGLEDGALTSESGELVGFNSVFGPPIPITPNVPVGAFEGAKSSILSDMDRVGAEEEAARGEAPGSVRGVEGIARLEERNDLVFWHPAISLKEGLRVCGGLILGLAHRYYKEERLIKIVGRDWSFEVSSFRGADLRGPFDVRVEIDSFRSQTKRAQRAEIMALAQALPDLFGSRAGQAKLIDLLDIGDLRVLLLQQNADRRRAQIENDILMSGQLVAALDFDDHEVHAEVHRVELLLTDRFETADAGTKTAALDHYAQHMGKLQAAREAQLEQMAMARGVPGQKGVASAPRMQSLGAGA